MLGHAPFSWNKWLGAKGERVAARFLRRRGLRIITRNFETPHGELDLIAREGDALVFVEVKTRDRGTPADAVNHEKRLHLVRSARYFLRRHDLIDDAIRIRFDIVAVVWPAGRGRPTIEHFPDAFEPADLFPPRS